MLEANCNSNIKLRLQTNSAEPAKPQVFITLNSQPKCDNLEVSNKYN